LEFSAIRLVYWKLQKWGSPETSRHHPSQGFNRPSKDGRATIWSSSSL